MTPVIPKKEKDTINRRTFLAKSAGCTAGLTLLAFPGIIAEGMAAKGAKSKKEIYRELADKVDKYMPMYGSCSQATFCALNEQFKLNADDTVRALKSFTGGLALKGETCGGVSGALLAIGFIFQPKNQKGNEKAGPSMKHAGIFFERFKKEFGSTICRGVQEHQYGRSYNLGDPEEMKLFKAASKNGKCKDVVKKAVFMVCDIILANS
ncbi:MAG: C_GCAxxG_C_C family protein [bacterium]|nr:C_GCAxxG_C_C family protein [bacterium]